MASNKANVLAVPSEVFSVHFRVVDGHVLRFPERIFGIDDGIVNLHVLGILKTIVALHVKAVKLDVLAVHEGIVAFFNLHVLQFYVLTVPKILFSVGKVRVGYIDSVYTAKQFGSIDLATGHTAVA